MKKVICVLILIMIPNVIFAECNYTREVELGKLASKITYDRKYSKESGTFTVTLYNVIPQLYITYDGTVLNGDDNNEIEVSSIQEGTYLNFVVYSAKGTSCYSSLLTIYVTLPYYNVFYGSEECDGYEDILTVCSSQFTSYQVTKKILNDAINNYNNKIHNDPVVPDDKDTSIISGIKEFISLWGMKILLVVVTIGLSIWYFQIKLRKTKHGI